MMVACRNGLSIPRRGFATPAGLPAGTYDVRSGTNSLATARTCVPVRACRPVMVHPLTHRLLSTTSPSWAYTRGPYLTSVVSCGAAGAGGLGDDGVGLFGPGPRQSRKCPARPVPFPG